MPDRPHRSATEFGAIAHRLTLRPPETEFDRGIRRFGYLLTSAMLVMVLLVFVAHMFRGRPPVETLLFAIALAVGLSPELLPAILSVNLARGAQMMARRGVLVRRLNAIENLGSMDVLCTDKTGTLTEGVVQVEGAYDRRGQPRQEVLELGAVQCGARDRRRQPARRRHPRAAHAGSDARAASSRRSRSISCASASRVVVEDVGRHSPDRPKVRSTTCWMSARAWPTAASSMRPRRAAARAALRGLDRAGIRVLAVASRARRPHRRPMAGKTSAICVFAGFLTFLDRPKEGVTEVAAQLASVWACRSSSSPATAGWWRSTSRHWSACVPNAC